eukprot:Lankesteria_metandrocarpae@DN775_c0_g1_i1.p1
MDRKRYWSSRKDVVNFEQDVMEFDQERWVRLKDRRLYDNSFQRYDEAIMYVRIDKDTDRPKLQNNDNEETVAQLAYLLQSFVPNSQGETIAPYSGIDTIHFKCFWISAIEYPFNDYGLKLWAAKLVEDSVDDALPPSPKALYDNCKTAYRKITPSCKADEHRCILPAIIQNDLGPSTSLDDLSALHNKLLDNAYVKGKVTSMEPLQRNSMYNIPKNRYCSKVLHHPEYGYVNEADLDRTGDIWRLYRVQQHLFAVLRIPHFFPYKDGKLKRFRTPGEDNIQFFVGPAAVLLVYHRRRITYWVC